MSARKVSIPGRRTVTAALRLAVLAGAARGDGALGPEGRDPPRTRSAGSPASRAARRRTAASATQGLQAALAYVNKNNVAGRTIKVFYADDAATPTTAADVCNRLVNQTHVNAIVGFESTPSTPRATRT